MATTGKVCVHGECQQWWILPGIRCDWGSNRAYPRTEQLFCRRFAVITALKAVPVALEGSDDPCSEINSSTFTDGLNLWHAVMCGFFGCFFLSQQHSLKQLDACNYFHYSYVRTILWGNDCCILRWSPVMSHTWQYPPPDILVHKDTCRTLCLHSSQSVLVQS